MKYLDKIGKPFLSNRFLFVSICLSGVFAFGFVYNVLLYVGLFCFSILLLAISIDFLFLYFISYKLIINREVEEKLSNGDVNEINYKIEGDFKIPFYIELLDEYPAQLQLRKTSLKFKAKGKNFTLSIPFEINPKTRGEYAFGRVKALISTPFGVIQKLQSFSCEQKVKVYPSIKQLKKYSFLAFTNRLEEVGIRNIRKVGNASEFDQIKEFKLGDDIKHINWKATARRNQLMVNHYEQERSQNIYLIVDKGRMMHMPFNGMTLFDYSVNAALSMAGVAKQKGDKVGFVSFSNVIGTWLPSKSSPNVVSEITEALYHQGARKKESDFSRLYKNARLRINSRSFLILFTNFESIVSLNRQMKYLKSLAKNHLVIMILFQNQEIVELSRKKESSETAYFDQTMAEKFIQEKQLIARELNKNGIYTVLTSPENLTISVINKYLELKSRNLL